MCDCINEVNKKLAEKNLNTVIDVPFLMDDDMNVSSKRKASIVTAKADKSVRKKPVSLFAAFCPFCGEEY